MSGGPRSWRRIQALAGGAGTRIATNLWLVAQGSTAAGVAWLIAELIADHPQPFFAPIAAVVALNASRGQRGVNAVRLMWGVLLGIAAGEVALATLGPYAWSLAIATLAAMVLALVFTVERIVIAQAAVGAILTMATGNPYIGPQRIIDALIGTGVALVFSQLLFPAEPIALLRRVETRALQNVAGSLHLIGSALEHGDDERARRAATRLRSLRDELSELERTRKTSRDITRHSPLWWGRSAPVVRESENAGQLDLLANSALALARMVLASPKPAFALGSQVTALAAAIGPMVHSPGARAVRQDTANGALSVARKLPGYDDDEIPPVLRSTARLVALDIMVFAGVDSDEAVQTAGADAGHVDVPTPPTARSFRLPKLPRWRRRRS